MADADTPKPRNGTRPGPPAHDRAAEQDRLAEHDRLAVHTFRHGGRLVIEALGVVSLATVTVLEAVLQTSAADGDALVTLDLRRVEFLDSSGLALLVTCSRRLRTPALPRAPRVLVLPGRQPDRVLKMGRFDSILEIAHDIGPAGPL